MSTVYRISTQVITRDEHGVEIATLVDIIEVECEQPSFQTVFHLCRAVEADILKREAAEPMYDGEPKAGS